MLQPYCQFFEHRPLNAGPRSPALSPGFPHQGIESQLALFVGTSLALPFLLMYLLPFLITAESDSMSVNEFQ